jgi:four helix bundle protein
MKDFRKLKVWERAHQLVLAVYHTTASFPREETYGLTAQIRRSASSIPSNIAEGCGRDGDSELARFCLIARGSASELEYQILLAHDLKLIPADHYEELSQEISEIKRMLTVLVQKLTAAR